MGAIWYPSLGQEGQPADSIRTQNLDEVFIIAGRYERPLQDIARSVSVITAEQIQNTPYINVTDLLSRESGLFVVGQGQTPGTNQSIFMQGANANQVIILMDGVRLTDPSTPNGALDLSELSLLNIQRIEILKGGQGSMYGSSGIGGVINIVTKKPKDGFSGNVTSQFSTLGDAAIAKKGGGSLSYRHASGFYANLSTELQNVTGLDATIDTITSGRYKSNDRDQFTKIDYQTNLGYQKNAWDVSLNFKNVDQKAQVDAGAFRDDDNSTVDFSRQLLTYQASYQLPSGSLSFLGSYSQLKRIFENDSSVIDFDGQTDQSYSRSTSKGRNSINEIQYQGRFSIGEYVLGVGMSNESMDFESYFFSNAFGPFEFIQSYDTVDLQINNQYVFGQLNLKAKGNQFIEKLALTLGVRFNHNSTYGSQFSYDLSPSFTTDKLRLFGAISGGFQNPTLIQLFDPSGTFGSLITRGNSNLTPEQSLGFQLGWDQRLTKKLKFSTLLFATQVRDVIEYVYLWDRQTAISELSFLDYKGDTYLNLSQLNTRGFESSIAYSGSKISGKISYQFLAGDFSFDPADIDNALKGDYYIQSFNNGSFIESDQTTDGLVRRPSSQLQADLAFRPVDHWTVGFNYRRVDARNDVFYNAAEGPFGALNTLALNPYNVLNFNAGYSLTKFYAGVQVENITNENYQEIQGFRSRGRGIGLKLNYYF